MTQKKSYKAYRGGVAYESKEEMIKAIELSFKNDVEQTTRRLNFLNKKQATYYFVRLITAFIKLKKGVHMDDTDAYVTRMNKVARR